MPVDSGNDLFVYKLPELPTNEYQILRPYTLIDERQVYDICTKSYLDMIVPDCSNMLLPEQVRDLIADSMIGPFTTLCPEFCMIAQDNITNIIGFAAAAADINIFQRNIELCWIPSLKEKYPKLLLDNSTSFTPSTKLNEMLTAIIEEFYNYSYQCPVEVFTSYPAIINIGLINYNQDLCIVKRLLTVLLAALRANGCFGAHVRIKPDRDTQQMQLYYKLGFADVYKDSNLGYLYLGRRF